MKDIKNKLRENILFVIVLLIMAVYYAVMMFTNKPWYDELYTYYSFISRGPIYAGIHWPVPNNHVLYSVLSAFLDYFGNPYIGLRGISYLASLLNMILLYKLTHKFMNKYLSVCCVMLYISVYLVNSLSIQGRGYTLTISCYLTALLCLYQICCNQDKLRYYIIYALSLTAGLYAIMSSAYWVFSVCFVGGIFLLYKKEYKKLFRLIAASICAAFMTVFLYTIIWLAIGSNLLSKDPSSAYYGIYQVTIILKDPIHALMTGVNYMLATPYIQSIERSSVITGLFTYFSMLFELFYSRMGKAITVFLAIALLVSLILVIGKKVKTEKYYFLACYLMVSLLITPVMLIIQSVQPYKRVFSYLAVPVSILIVSCFHLLKRIWKKDSVLQKAEYALTTFLVIFAATLLMSSYYRAPLADRENKIEEMFHFESDISSIYYTDDYQKYVLKFYFDIEPEEKNLNEAEYVLIAREILDPAYIQAQWPVLLNHESLDYSYIEENFILEKENDEYLLYKKPE